MALEALCPTCGAVFSLRDDMQGKKVRCTKCEQIFTAGGDAKAKSAGEKQSVQSKPAAPAKKSAARDDEVSTAKKNRAAAKRGRDDDDDDDRPRKGSSRRGKDDDDDDDTPRAKASSRRGKDDGDDDDDDNGKAKAKKKRTYHDDDDDDDDVPRKPAKKKSGGGAGLILGIIGGVVFLVLLVCGGISYWIYHGVSPAAEELQAQVNNANNGNPGFPNVGDPFPGQNPEKKIASVDDALRDLKSNNEAERRAALDWLAKANLDNGRQADVSRALNPLLKDPDNGTREKAVNALKVWVTKDNLDGLIQVLNEGNPERWHHENGLPRAAMEAVGKLQDEKAAEPVWRYRAGPSGNEADRSLRSMGQAAGEKAALARFDDPNDNLRNASRSILVFYGTKDALKLKQVAADLKSDDRNRRNAAFDYLANNAVVESERPTVAPALNAALEGPEVSDLAMRAVEKWAAADNVPALVKAIADDHFPHRKRAMALLGRLKDVRGAEPLAAKLLTGERRDAADALIALGPVGKPAVEKYATNPDKGVQKEVDRILASYGSDTSNLGLTRLLTDLESTEDKRRGNAARALFAMKTEPAFKMDPAQQEKVAKALEKAAGDATFKDGQLMALQALGVWGTKDNAATLIKIIEDKEKNPGGARYLAMDNLGKWKVEDAIKPIALYIGPNKGDRDRAGMALRNMGPDLGDKIEPIVLEGLSNSDQAIVLECVKILGAVGTKKSIVPLNNLGAIALKQKKVNLFNECGGAVNQIQKRGK